MWRQCHFDDTEYLECPPNTFSQFPEFKSNITRLIVRHQSMPFQQFELKSDITWSIVRHTEHAICTIWIVWTNLTLDTCHRRDRSSWAFFSSVAGSLNSNTFERFSLSQTARLAIPLRRAFQRIASIASIASHPFSCHRGSAALHSPIFSSVYGKGSPASRFYSLRK